MQARPTLHSRSPSKRPLTGAVLQRKVTAAPGLSRPRARSTRRPAALLVCTAGPRHYWCAQQGHGTAGVHSKAKALPACTAGPRVQERALTLGQEEVHLKGRGPPRAHSTEAHTDKPSSSPRLPPGRCHPRGAQTPSDTFPHRGSCPRL